MMSQQSAAAQHEPGDFPAADAVGVTFFLRKVVQGEMSAEFFGIGVQIVMNRPHAGIIHAVGGLTAGTPDQIRISGGIHKGFAFQADAPALVFHIHGVDRFIFIGLRIHHQRIQPEIHACLFQQFIHGEDEGAGCELRTVTAVLRLPRGFAPVLLFQAVRTVLDTCFQQFFHQSVGDLGPLSIAELKIEKHQPGGGKSAGKNGLFNEGDFRPLLRSGKGGGDSGDSGTGNDHIIGNSGDLFRSFHGLSP